MWYKWWYLKGYYRTNCLFWNGSWGEPNLYCILRTNKRDESPVIKNDNKNIKPTDKIANDKNDNKKSKPADKIANDKNDNKKSKPADKIAAHYYVNMEKVSHHLICFQSVNIPVKSNIMQMYRDIMLDGDLMHVLWIIQMPDLI